MRPSVQLPGEISFRSGSAIRLPLRSVQRTLRVCARLVAFFAAMYYAGLRPEEAISLRADDMLLPAQAPNEDHRERQDTRDDDDWGELHLRTATPDAGSEWTDDGSQRERRQLNTAPRRQPDRAHSSGADQDLARPPRILRYRARWPPVPRCAGRRTAHHHLPPCVGQGTPGRPDRDGASLSPGRRPDDLRHACLSTWLNGGVYPAQVAEWAGHGVDVLLRIYAMCVVGQDELAKRHPGPHRAAHRDDNTRSRWSGVSAGQQPRTRTFRQWGGWGSNPRPADYESAALTG
jgi:integrase